MSVTIKVHIDKLVLHDFEGIDQRQIGQAVEAELAQLLSAHDVSSIAQSSHAHHVNVYQPELTSKSDGLGKTIAQSVYQGVNP